MSSIAKLDPNIQRLIEAHPLLFRGVPPVVWSDLPTGWYRLVDTLCSAIEVVLGPEACAAFEVRQIKQKFGALRFYYRLDGRESLHVDIMMPTGRQHVVISAEAAGDDDDRVRELVDAACAASETACEVCGEPAHPRNLNGWLTTLCDVHDKVAREAALQRMADNERDLGLEW